MATACIKTPIPSQVTAASLIQILHDHQPIIDALAPGNTASKLMSGDPAAMGTPCVYNITAPTPIGTSTYPLTITNLLGGVDTLVQPKPPVGKLEIRAKWRVANGELKEDVEIDGNFVTKRFVLLTVPRQRILGSSDEVLTYIYRMAKGNVEKNHPGQHGVLIEKAGRA